MKYLTILLMCCTAQAGMMTAREAKFKSEAALEHQKSTCVIDWEKDIEDQIAIRVDGGECDSGFFTDKCVSKKMLNKKISKLKRLGYRVTTKDNQYYTINWCGY